MKKPAKYIFAIIAAAVMLSAMPFSALAEGEAAESGAAAETVIGEGNGSSESSSDETDNGENSSVENGGTENPTDAEGSPDENGSPDDNTSDESDDTESEISALSEEEDTIPSFSGGEGTEYSPYKIESPDDLKALADWVNSGHSCNGRYFVLTVGFDLGGSEDNQWTPIGNISASFSGVFDGGTHKITGLYINATTDDSDSDYKGLFGYIDGGTVRNLIIEDCSVTGRKNVGAVAGWNNGGTIEHCYVIETEEGKGSIYSIKDRIGGIVGTNKENGIVKKCYNTCSVYGAEVGVGGIAGYNFSSIINCHNVGLITARGGKVDVGGIASSGTPVHCYYLEGCNADGTTFNNGLDAAETKEKFESGEINYLLYNYPGEESHVWGQELGVDNHPVFKDFPVIKITFVHGEDKDNDEDNEDNEGNVDNEGNEENEDDEPDVIYINPGAVPKEKFPNLEEREGYELNWSTSAAGDSPYDFVTALEEDTTFYATFTKKQEEESGNSGGDAGNGQGGNLGNNTSGSGDAEQNQKPGLTYLGNFNASGDAASAESSGDKSSEDVSSGARISDKGELLDDHNVKFAGLVMIAPICMILAAVLKKRSKARK